MLSKLRHFVWATSVLALGGCVEPGGSLPMPQSFFGGYSLLGLLILVLDIVAIVRVAQSGESTLAKLVWIVVILAFPVVGLLIWLLMGPGRKR